MQNNNLTEKATQLKNELSPKDKDYKLIYTLKNKIIKTIVTIFRFEPPQSKSVTLKGNQQ